MHSREISLHDLNILHDGSDIVGPLRLLLRAVVPRFIIQYYALQESIQRLSAAAETEEGELDDGLCCFSSSLPDSLQLFKQNITNSMTQVKNNTFFNKRKRPTTPLHTPRSSPKVRRDRLPQKLKNPSKKLFSNRLKKHHKRIRRTLLVFKNLRPNITKLPGRQHTLSRMRTITRLPMSATKTNLPAPKI